MLCVVAIIEEIMNSAVNNGSKAEERHPQWIFSADRVKMAVDAPEIIMVVDVIVAAAVTAANDRLEAWRLYPPGSIHIVSEEKRPRLRALSY